MAASASTPGGAPDGDLFLSLSAYVAAALTLTVGLAWNSAFTSFFERTPWLKTYGPFTYAIMLTVGTYVFMKVVQRGAEGMHLVAQRVAVGSS